MPGKVREDLYLPEGGRINLMGFWESDTHRQCSKCRCIFEKTSSMSWCHKCNTDRRLSATPEWRMHQRARCRAKIKGREFNLKVQDVVIPEVCPILGIRLVTHVGGSGAFADSPSLDRRDNGKGYTKENIQVVSQRANQMKGDASKEELLAFARWILETYEEN